MSFAEKKRVNRTKSEALTVPSIVIIKNGGHDVTNYVNEPKVNRTPIDL